MNLLRSGIVKDFFTILSLQVLAHIKEKSTSIKAEEALLQERLSQVEKCTEEAQKDVMAAKEQCIKMEYAQKLTMKDFSRVTEPTLVKEYQV